MENTVASKVAAPSEDVLARLVRYFEFSEELTADARAKAEKCRDYFDGKQYTDEERKKIQKRKQPVLTFNKVKRKVNFLTGYEIQQRMDPMAFPRNPTSDEEGAAAATDALRYVQESQMLPEKMSDAFEDGIVEGMGGVEVLYDPQKDCVDIKHVEWDRIFYDPYSSRHDFSDASYVGIVVWMDEERARVDYADKADEINGAIERATSSRGTASETFDDKPSFKTWVSLGDRKRIRICQIYYLENGAWHWAHYTKGVLLKGGEKVAYVDGDGLPQCPLVMWSCYVDRQNNRYGEVDELIDIQDEINKRRSRLLYSLSVRQVRMDAGAVDRVEATREELARPDGIIKTNPGKMFEILRNEDQIAGHVSLLQEAKSEMEFAGPNSSLMGDTRAGASGRAIIASQQGGLSELGRVMSRYRNFKVRVYRQIWARIRQFWRAEKWIRITDDDRNVRFVGLNRPETQGDVLLAKARQEGMPPEEYAKAEAEISALPMAKIPTGRTLANVAEIDVDIVLDETVDTITLQQEQFGEMVDLAKSGIPIPTETLIMASSLRDKQKILQSLKDKQSPQIPQEMQQLQMRGAVAEVAGREADAAKKNAEAEKITSETKRGEIEFVAGGISGPMNTGIYPA